MFCVAWAQVWIGELGRELLLFLATSARFPIHSARSSNSRTSLPFCRALRWSNHLSFRALSRRLVIKSIVPGLFRVCSAFGSVSFMDMTDRQCIERLKRACVSFICTIGPWVIFCMRSCEGLWAVL